MSGRDSVTGGKAVKDIKPRASVATTQQSRKKSTSDAVEPLQPPPELDRKTDHLLKIGSGFVRDNALSASGRPSLQSNGGGRPISLRTSGIQSRALSSSVSESIESSTDGAGGSRQSLSAYPSLTLADTYGAPVDSSGDSYKATGAAGGVTPPLQPANGSGKAEGAVATRKSQSPPVGDETGGCMGRRRGTGRLFGGK
jgi:hypothetical protein